MLIKYGISRRIPGKKKRYEGLNSVIDIGAFDWDRDDHKLITNAIAAKHPGWSIVGYGPKDD